MMQAGGKQNRFFISVVGLSGDYNKSDEATLVEKYSLLFDMLGITLRSNVGDAIAVASVKHAKDSFVFLPRDGFAGFSADTGRPILERRIFSNQLPTAIATAKKYEIVDVAAGGALVHTLLGYSLKYPAQILIINTVENALAENALVAGFISKHKPLVVSLRHDDWQRELLDALYVAGFAKEVGDA